MMKKRMFYLFLAICLCLFCLLPVGFQGERLLAAPEYSATPDARSCILMDGKTGAVLYEYNADEALPPASVTKVMTMLLVFEALDEGTLSLNQTVRISETAASMGGSQIFLAAGEEMSVDDLLKGLIVSSARSKRNYRNT